MATVIKYTATFDGTFKLTDKDVLQASETFDDLIVKREKGVELEGFDKYVSHSADLTEFIKRCIDKSVRVYLKEHFKDADYTNIGNIKVKFNG